MPFRRLLDFEGPIRSVALDVFVATARTRKNIFVLPTVLRKLENANNEKHKQNEGPIHLSFLHVLAFHEAAQRLTIKLIIVTFRRHLVDLGSHCNVGATADTF